MTITPTARTRDASEPLRRISIGEVSIHPLVQLHYRVDPARFFPQIAEWSLDKDAWYSQPPYFESDALVIDMGGFLVRTPERVILVDAGVGNGKSRPNPNFDHRTDDWLGLFSQLGLTVEDVDTVLFTHLHVDHVGFATTWVDGEWTPTFPNARYHTTAAELDYWTSPEAAEEMKRLGDYISDSILPLQAAGVLELSPPDLVVSEHVRLISAPGHTPGNVCVEVRSEGRRAVFAGDMIHHPLQLAFPQRSTDYCIDDEGATSARTRLLRGLDADDLLLPAHFPHAMPGRVAPDAHGRYRFTPEWGESI